MINWYNKPMDAYPNHKDYEKLTFIECGGLNNMTKLEQKMKMTIIKCEIDVNLQDRQFKDGDVGYINGFLDALLGYNIIDLETYRKLKEELLEEYD